MHGRHVLFCVTALVALVFVFSSTAYAEQVAWPAYRADALQYAANGLPDPIMIYVYTSDAKLVSVLGTPRRTSDEKALGKIGKMIADQNFTHSPKTQLATTAKSFKYFLLDQDYNIRKIVSRESKYTLILTGWVVKDTDCAFYTDIQSRYKTLIRKSMPKPAGGEPVYSVAILQIGSPKQTLSCMTK